MLARMQGLEIRNAVHTEHHGPPSRTKRPCAFILPKGSFLVIHGGRIGHPGVRICWITSNKRPQVRFISSRHYGAFSVLDRLGNLIRLNEYRLKRTESHVV